MVGYHFFKCKCGRNLRVSDDRAGTLVRCWDCREEVLAPLPDLSGRLAADMLQGLGTSSSREQVGLCMLAAIVATVLLLLGRVGLGIGGVLGLAAAFAYRESLRGWIRRGAAGLRKHPIAMLAVPLVLPLGLVAIEAALLGVAYQQDWLRYLVLDVTPRSGAAAVLGDDASVRIGDFAEISDAEVFRMYALGLRRGYALTWTVPASLIRGMAERPDAGYAMVNAASWNDWVDPVHYLGFRAFCSIAALTGLMTLVALKARWVDLIGTVEARYLASSVSRSALPARARLAYHWHVEWVPTSIRTDEPAGPESELDGESSEETAPDEPAADEEDSAPDAVGFGRSAAPALVSP